MDGSSLGGNRSYDMAALGVLDGPCEPVLDALVLIASRAIRAPFCAIAMIDDRDETVRFRAHTGFPPDVSMDRSVPFDKSFCARVRMTNAPFAVSNARRDPIGAEHPLATKFGIQSYLGAPIHDPALGPVGIIAVMDVVPRIWSEEDKHLIAELARVATQNIMLRAALATVRIIAMSTRHASPHS